MQDSFFEEVVAFATKQLVEDGDLNTIIIGETMKGKRLAFVGSFQNDREKESYLNLVSLTFLIHKVCRYVAIGEAWMTTPGSNGKPKRPNQNPNTKECLIVVDVNYEKPPLGSIFELIRNKSGKIKNLKELVKMEKMEGRFTELLPNKNFEIPEELASVIEKFWSEQGLTLH